MPSDTRFFLAPRRESLGEIRALVARAADAKEAWHHLASLKRIPSSWADDPVRRFVDEPGDPADSSRPTREPAFASHLPHPSTIEHCALFASDAAGVAAVEAASRDLVERLRPWGAPPFSRAVWWVIPRHHYDRAATDTRPHCYALPYAFATLYNVLGARGQAPPFDLLSHGAAYAALWRSEVERGTALPNFHARRLSCSTFAELPNPFEPLATIEAAGYATLPYMGAMGALSGTVFLVAPVD